MKGLASFPMYERKELEVPHYELWSLIRLGMESKSLKAPRNLVTGDLEITNGSFVERGLNIRGKSLIDSAELTAKAFSQSSMNEYGGYLVAIALLLFAFSTASSAATIPITLKTVEEELKVEKSVASFSVPLGATINMDGTSLYQGVAAVFIAQAFGLDLDLSSQLGIILTATLASIGTAAVPSAGIVMLVIVLAQAGICLLYTSDAADE